MATAATAYKQSFGFDAPPYTYADFEESDVLVLVGSNLCIAHPIMWERIARNPNHPEIIVVEITRIVPEIQQVEVTRLVEVEKEVTRIVEIPRVDPGTALPTPDLELLQIEFWPDFDQPAVLVLLTGSLPPGRPLPAELIIPVPPDAQINAVAQIDEDGMAAIDYQPLEDAVLFQSDTAAFRVEYYVPYQQEENRRAYDFQWLAPFTVDELAVQLQRPANAIDLAAQPEPSAVSTDPDDSLDYYLFDPLSVPRGVPYRLAFNYTMISDTLTIEELYPTPPAQPPSPLHDQQVNFN
jgi:hypothetical protein